MYGRLSAQPPDVLFWVLVLMMSGKRLYNRRSEEFSMIAAS